MNQVVIDELLQTQGLKKTKVRMALLSCLLEADHAHSYAELKQALGERIDKSTLYRNLAAFEEAGIIHRIEHSGIAKYAFGKVHDHGQNHAHFICEKCETVYCVEQMPVTEIDVPKGFKTKTVQTLIKGTCADC